MTEVVTRVPEEKKVLSQTLILALLLCVSSLLLFPSLELSFLGLPFSFTFLPSLIIGAICAILAYNKYKNPSTGCLVGFLFGPLAILYYILSKREMTVKEKEIREWKLEKEYQRMKRERGDSL